MKTAAYYRERAEYMRSLAHDADPRTRADLLKLAEDHEAEARRLEPDNEPPVTSLN